MVVRAIKRGDLYALTHPDWYPMVAERHEAIAEAFREQEAFRQQAAGEGLALMRARIAYYDPPRRPAPGNGPTSPRFP